VNDDEMPVSFAIAAGEAGVYRDLMGQWYGYLSEAEDKLE
jgi:hypothetical protein